MISVVMPVRNCVGTITSSLNLILESPHVCEILVADAGSSDGTEKILRDHCDHRVKLVSTSDNGIYHGANKALRLCSGSYILFMNANDFFNSSYLDLAVKVLADKKVDYVYGCIEMGGKIVKPRINRVSVRKRSWQIMPFPHVSLVVKKSTHEKLAGYDDNFKIAADLDYINQLILGDFNGVFIDEIAANCSPGGVSSGFKHIREAREVAIKNGRSLFTASLFSLLVVMYRIYRR